MPLDQLLAALERDAREQADRLVAEARAEAERVRDAAERDIARRRAATEGAREREHHAALEQALSNVRRAARRDVLEARDRLLARVFSAARAALPAAINTPAYRATLPRRLEAGLACFDGAEPVVVRCSPPLVDVVQAALPPRADVRVRGDPEAGSGFRLTTPDGAIEVDDTLETRLAARRPRLARAALRRLDLEPEANVG